VADVRVAVLASGRSPPVALPRLREPRFSVVGGYAIHTRAHACASKVTVHDVHGAESILKLGSTSGTWACGALP
jgi:hypothetical protein